MIALMVQMAGGERLLSGAGGPVLASGLPRTWPVSVASLLQENIGVCIHIVLVMCNRL